MEYRTLGTVATYINGRAFKPSEWEQYGLPIIRIQNLNDEDAAYNYCSQPLDEKFKIHKGDLLFAWSASLGAHIWNNDEAWLNQHIFKVIPDKDVDKMFLYYYLCKVTMELYSKAHGTGMVHITKKPFMNTKIPLPSLEEQERIVAKIEELFSDLDNAVETLNATKAQLEVYRQAVLKEAFDIKRFSKVEMENIVDDIKIGPFGTMLHKEDYIVGGIPVINPQHIKKQTIIPSKNTTVSDQKANELGSYRLQKNDVIMGRRGEMGRTAAISSIEEGWVCGTGSIIFRLKPEFDATFYSQILSSPDTIAYLDKSATGTTMKNLNEKIVKHIPVPMITREEQQEITSLLETRLSICENIEKTVVSALQQATAMRQSILKQAFEGRLL